MQKNILFLFLLFSKLSFSCQCPTLPLISKELCKNYDVIFYGKVDSVISTPNDGICAAYFTINELYKGAVEESVNIDFDCSSACMMSFSKDEEWIIYSKFERFNLMTVNICEHSRKQFIAGEQDIYQISSGRTFLQEKQFLQTTFGIQSFTKRNKLNQQQNELAPHNDQPGPMNKLWLILISVATMAIVYYITRNKKEN